MGRPKALLRIGGRPILSYLLDRIDWPGPKYLVTAPNREHPPGWEAFDREWVDPVVGLGPLRGVLTALENVNAPLLVITTVDMPCVRAHHLAWLVARLEQSAVQLGMMCRRAGGRIEPFPLALRKEAEAVVRQSLHCGNRSVHDMLDDPLFAAIDAPHEWGPEVWTNLNAPDDLRRFTEDNRPVRPNREE